MKLLIAGLCVCTTLCAVPMDPLQEELNEPAIGIIFPEDLPAIDTSSLSSESLNSKELEMPLPVFESQRRKSSFLAVGLSSLIPGLGHVYLGDIKTAGGLFGSVSLGLGVGLGMNSSSESKEFIHLTSTLAVQTAWFYGMYAAYRDVRTYNGQHGYSYKMPQDSFADLTKAPFNLRVLKKPEVWGGLLGSLAIAMMHIPNAAVLEPQHRQGYYTFILPLMTLSGMYDEWLTYKNHSLKECVAIHAWYDFILFSIGAIANQSLVKGRTEFAIALPF